MSKAKTPRLSEVVSAYIASRRATCSPVTAKQDEIVCRRFVLALGDPLVTKFTAESVELWFHSLLAPHRTRDGRDRDPVKATTYNYLYARIKALTQYMSKRQLLHEDVLMHVRPMKRDIRNRLRLDSDMLWAVIDSAENARDRAILATAINTGLRSSEVSQLKVGDVDLPKQEIHVRISKSRLEDVMPLTQDLQVELSSWLNYYRAYVLEHHGRILDASDWLFPARTGPYYAYRTGADGRRERYHQEPGLHPTRPALKLHTVVHRALEAVGLPTTGEGIHTLRRSAARAVFDSLVEEKKHDGALRITSTFLHHSSCSTTEVYLGLDKDREARDQHLRGRSLLGPRPSAPSGNVVHLKRS